MEEDKKTDIIILPQDFPDFWGLDINLNVF